VQILESEYNSIGITTSEGEVGTRDKSDNSGTKKDCLSHKQEILL
jgi:hypothetical protein